MPTQATPVLKTAMIVPSPTLPNEDAVPAHLDQGKVIEKNKVADLHQAEASKVLQEAQVENKRVRAEVDRLKVASKIQTTEVECLREMLQREEEASAGLRAALTPSKDKRRRNKEEVGAEREQAIEVFKSSKAMEDIKIAFVQESFLEGFKICMRRVAKNFSEVDLDLLIDEPSKEADASNAGAASPITESTLGAPEPAAEAPRILPVIVVKASHLQITSSHYLKAFL
ncbi:hypothetical protein COCNU_scaffold021527G000010 [Cocos nucifera]|nr:hypothetical protein [Cocos nucifera]